MKRYGPPAPADILTDMLKRRGITIDPLRLEERVAPGGTARRPRAASTSPRSGDWQLRYGERGEP
jgi:hypothetical protein